MSTRKQTKTKEQIAILKSYGITQPQIAERLGITLSALEKKARGTNPTSLLETQELIRMIDEQARATDAESDE